MNDLDANLYREELMDLVKHPSHKGKLTSPTIKQHGVNPMCGDDITLQIHIKDGLIAEFNYYGEACAICMAASEVLADSVEGKSISSAERFDKDSLLDLININLTTSRVKCATLPLETMLEGLKEWKIKSQK